MLMQLAVPDVERLVVYQEPDDLAVGDVDDRLPVLGIRETHLCIRQWPGLVEPVEIRSRKSVRLALLEIAPQPDVAVGQREQRFGLSENVQVERGLADLPRLDRKRVVMDHDASNSSARSATTV